MVNELREQPENKLKENYNDDNDEFNIIKKPIINTSRN
jgi:hypothetical protein